MRSHERRSDRSPDPYHARVTADPSGRLRLTVLGCSSAAPDPGSPAAGFLLDWGSTAVLLDVGQGVVRRLESVIDPHDLAAVVVGHMHADHFLDLAGLRYLYPWGEPATVRAVSGSSSTVVPMPTAISGTRYAIIERRVAATWRSIQK
jgi:ribonuclease BN (tRNA processing enzyme)